jgi:capsular polysaccharide biosynthesis protein
MGNKLHNCVLSTQKVRFSEVDSGNRERHWYIAAFLLENAVLDGYNSR